MGKKTALLMATLFSIILFSGCSVNSNAFSDSEDDNVMRIGYQKNGPLIILKSLGTLDERLESIGYAVEWNEFQAGPLLLEALNAESIDFGRTGNTPPIFAQAADSPFHYIAVGFSKYEGSGILVPQDSDIEELTDLKNKKIGFANGSSSHYLIVKALEKAGLAYSDIDPAFLNPGDARVAFEQGTIDAMVVWDPYAASTELHSDGKMLINGEGLTTDRDFFVATTEFSENHREAIEIILEEIEASSEWANTNHEDLVDMLAPILNLDKDSVKKTVERRVYGVEQITEEIIEEQQRIADKFYELDIIPKELDVKEFMVN
ncbi:aliphatic sulfonate ABC transporter substrate-binding protein [Virgibacillus sp. YIM 98842]|uniref:aliphatic sulfonate ABC transporter substrate-binding protein n=1 Tax=Virgibacillus sp. YIM 98842 TaxID=2663533 RepID=UPI001F0940CD|nr:aliphatic sulfonate ABC transporter substrate-binding protein [Virgibacillus sp. YIM 98842]